MKIENFKNNSLVRKSGVLARKPVIRKEPVFSYTTRRDVEKSEIQDVLRVAIGYGKVNCR